MRGLGIMIVPGRFTAPTFTRMEGLGQLPWSPTPSQVAKFAVEKVIENAKADPAAMENALGLVSLLESLLNIRRKIVFILDGYKKLVAEMSLNPGRFTPEEIQSAQEFKTFLESTYSSIYDFFVDPVEIPETLVGKIFAFLDPTFGLLAKESWPTTFTWIRDELLKQIPEKLGTKIVLERWKGPAPDMKSAQVFDVETWAPPAGMETDSYIVSESSRTSFVEDLKAIENLAPDMETAFKTIGVSLGVGGVAIAVRAGAKGIGWFARFLGTMIGKKGAEKAAKVGLVGLLRGKFAKVTAGSVIKWTAASAAVVAIVTTTVVALPKLPTAVGNLMEAVVRATNATKEGIETIVILTGIAFGIMLVGGAIIYVSSQD